MKRVFSTFVSVLVLLGSCSVFAYAYAYASALPSIYTSINDFHNAVIDAKETFEETREKTNDILEEVTSYIDFKSIVKDVGLFQIRVKQAYITLVYSDKGRSKDTLTISWNRAFYDDDSIYLQVARTRLTSNPVDIVFNGTTMVKGEVHRDGIHIGTQYFWVHNGYAVHVVVPAWLLELYPEETFFDVHVVYIGPLEWANQFADIGASDWFYDAVETVTTNGLFSGVSSDFFNPHGTMTRAMFTQVLANLEGVDLPEVAASRFVDVPVSAWYAPAVEWAASAGLVSGVGNNRFAPDDNITREQMALMLHNYIKWKGIPFPTGSETTPFADEDKISPRALEAIKAIQASGIIGGRPGNMFDPKTSATRAEAAAIFARFIEIAT